MLRLSGGRVESEVAMGRRIKRMVGVGVIGGVLVTATFAMAQGRDADGTRMQARQVAVGSTHSDRLSPPQDREDWYFVRVDEAVELKVSVRSRPASVALRLELQGATGDRLAVAATEQGSAQVAKRVNPGIYYMQVSGGDARYELSVR
ncbi:hypothetical protein EA187_15695 [Lujinxingia sediminis]|uniref:Peptidase C-terminal archaeal/bacterial domain-containing protein n=1 Tax=Lujinxingia sediminis TaxID=2480984 RepID=A0ABY0CQ62_9DELT|nr:hypothetical protein [Lujinxingia sediminis]RVU42629.1 hypothetical protein EA187_15695 [Lujinxingia sediminis]